MAVGRWALDVGDIRVKLEFSSDTEDSAREERPSAMGQRSAEAQLIAQDQGNPAPEGNVQDYDPPQSTQGCSAARLEEYSSVLRGMLGYKLTQSDLQFIEEMKEEKQLKQLKEELADVQSSLTRETAALELVTASNRKAHAELQKFPSCEELVELAKAFLGAAVPGAELEDLDAKCLLSQVKEEDVQRAVAQKRGVVAEMTEAHRKKAEQETEKQEKRILEKEHELHRMMAQLVNLKSQLDNEEEAYRDLESKATTGLDAAQIKVEKDADPPPRGRAAAVKAPSLRTRGKKVKPPPPPPPDNTMQESAGLRRSRRIANNLNRK